MVGAGLGSGVAYRRVLALDVLRVADQDYAVEHQAYPYDEFQFQFLVEQEVENDAGEHAVG